MPNKGSVIYVCELLHLHMSNTHSNSDTASSLQYQTVFEDVGFQCAPFYIQSIVCTDEGPTSFSDGDIYIVSRLQGVELCLLSKSTSLKGKRGIQTASSMAQPQGE